MQADLVTDFDTIRDALKSSPTGMLFSYDFRWPVGNGEMRVKAGFFHTRPECDNSLAKVLTEIGYTVPKWWQFWRWSEARPNKDVINIMGRND